jgi:hypothetical protein
MIATLGYAPGRAQAARVSGVLTGYESSNPLASRDLHFQNNITGDIYLSPTHSDGSFAVVVPPGAYSLRTETGAVLIKNVEVGQADLVLGGVSELAPLAPPRLWQSQAIAPTLLASPPPSTAYVMTSDTTPLPADASAVRKPEIDWSRPPPETQASASGAPNAVTGMATAPLPSPHTPAVTTPGGPSAPGAVNQPYYPPTGGAGANPPMP